MVFSKDSWFNSLPLEDYINLNKKYAEKVPDCASIRTEIGDLKITCGPILRLLGTLENGEDSYRGSLLLVIKDSSSNIKPKINYSIGPAIESDSQVEYEIQSSQFSGKKFYEEKEYEFWRFEIDLKLTEIEQKVKYEINGHQDASYQFFLPAKDQSMNIITYSCNGFSLGCDPKDYKSSLWCDVLRKHDKQRYHVMLGGGDQIYSDSIKLDVQEIQDWLESSNFLKKIKMVPSKEAVDAINNFYLKQYMAWFGQGFWKGKNGKTCQAMFPIAMSQIPSINMYDDHDILDGFGSYHDITMTQPVFKQIGNAAYKYYMLFQQHTYLEEEIHNSSKAEPSWIISDVSGRYINQKSHSLFTRLGKEISLLTLDCRTERQLKQINSFNTYDLVFERLHEELQKTPEVKHLLVMLGVPILYPRLVWLEKILSSPLLYPLKKLAQKGILLKGLVNEFDGGVEVLDDLNDHWCAAHHKKERNYLMTRLTHFSALHGVRITILSGDVHLCCIGRLRTRKHHFGSISRIRHNFSSDASEGIPELPESDPMLVFNVISSAIVNAAPPNAMATLLKKRSKIHHFNRHSNEDIVPIFFKDTDGSPRKNELFLNKRNWGDLILAKQSVYQKNVGSIIKKFPGPPSNGSSISLEENQKNVKYSMSPDSLITTLHVEKDKSDYCSESYDYELIIPRLDGMYNIKSKA